MAIEEKKVNQKIYIDLDGPDGNVFVLLGITSKLCDVLGYPKSQKDALLEQMRSGDYTNAVQTMENVFGDIIVFQARSETLEKLNLSPKPPNKPMACPLPKSSWGS